jgi:predicted nucleic acid-binding protein
MRVGLDTNVLVYAEGLNDAARKAAVVSLLRRLPPENVHLPVQAIAELFHVLVTKAKVAPADAKDVVLRWCDQYALVDTSTAVLLSAMELSSQHRLRTWDAIIMAAAASAGCRLLLSEDLQDGFTWNGVTVANPFAHKPNLLLAELLDS